MQVRVFLEYEVLKNENRTRTISGLQLLAQIFYKCLGRIMI